MNYCNVCEHGPLKIDFLYCPWCGESILSMKIGRFSIVNDGPDRWVLLDNETDDPAPVYETEDRAQKALMDATLSVG